MRILVELGSEPGGGTHVVYQVWAQPANLLGRWGIPIQIGLIQRRRFAAVFRQYDRQAAQPSSQVAREEPVQFVAGGKQRLESRQAALLGQGIVPTLVTELVTTLTNAGDLDVYRMRPYELADRWEASRRGVLELCLHAARIGILDSRWEILCPLCRGTEGSTTSLKEIRSTVHCESCNIDYTVNFERLVELVFRPNAAIRRVDVGEFCVGGPGVSSIGRSATRPLLVGS